MNPISLSDAFAFSDIANNLTDLIDIQNLAKIS